MKADVQTNADARGLRVAIVASAYHADVCGTMEHGAVEAFRLGAARGQLVFPAMVEEEGPEPPPLEYYI